MIFRVGYCFLLVCISVDPSGIIFHQGSLQTTSKTNLSFHVDTTMPCAVFEGQGFIKFTLPLPMNSSGSLSVEIQGSNMGCSDRFYVYEIPSIPDITRPGLYRCTLIDVVNTNLGNQRCQFRCPCAESCGSLRVAHMPHPSQSIAVRMCFVTAQWSVDLIRILYFNIIVLQ